MFFKFAIRKIYLFINLNQKSMKRIAMFFAFFVLGMQLSIAQTMQITGTVTSKDDGQPLPGATVLVKGTTTGVTTDFNGNYSITVPANAQILQVSFVGMKTQEIAITSKSVINFVMESEATKLDEVVVTALGIKREQKALGYSVTKVGNEDLVKAKEANIVNSLAGKVAGVYVNNSSGMAGSSARIVIRGNTSLNYNNQPLFIIDGVPFDNSEHKYGEALFYGSASNTGIDIDPSQIENVTVLKGAAATALYGSRASNGVIMITTKGSGTAPKAPVIEFSSNVSFDLIRPQKLQTSYGQGTGGVYYDGETRKTSLSWGPLLDTTNIPTYDRFGFFRKGHTYNNSISINGALGDKTNYYLSYSNYNQEGTVPNNTFKRQSFLAKFSSQVSEKVTISSKFEYIRSDNDRLPEGNGLTSAMWSILCGPVTYNFQPAVDSTGTQRLYRSLARNNHYYLKDNVKSTENRDRFIPSFSLEYKILPWISLLGRVGIDFYTNKTKYCQNTGVVGDYPDGIIIESSILNKEINSDIILQISKNITPDIKANLMLGNNMNSQYYSDNTVQGYTLNIPGYYNLSNVSTTSPTEQTIQKRTYSYFGQAELSYKDYLYLTLTGRKDWSSTLTHTGNNGYFYPSISTGFIFSELLKSWESILSFGKLRLSYAVVGHDAPAYSTNTSYLKANPNDGQRGNIQYPYNGTISYLESNVAGNPNLKPELSSEWEIGCELKLLNKRLGIDFSYYTKLSKDQIFSAPIAAETGFIQRVINAGEIANEGIELQMQINPILTKDFRWDIGITYTKNTNEVKKLTEGITEIQLAGFTDPGIFIKAGYPYGVIWGSRFKRNDKGQVLVDDEGYPITDDNYGPIGNSTPKWIGSLNNAFTYKNISLSALVDIRVGGNIVNLDESYTAFYGTSYLTRDRSKPVVAEGVNENTGEKNTVEVDPQDYYQTVSSVSEFMVQKTDFIRLREITLGYSLPKKLLKNTFIKGVDISVSGRNLWLKTDESFTGSDPEQSLYGSSNGQGLINFQVPSTKSYSFGIKVTF
jgi:TonB-linked SusC/RagA family outer membrane protein